MITKVKVFKSNRDPRPDDVVETVEPGLFWLNTDTNQFFLCHAIEDSIINTRDWASFGTGGKGDTGPPGIQGLQGPIGPKGDKVIVEIPDFKELLD